MKEERVKTLWEKEWKGMPEYKNQEIKPYMSIIVHFKNEQDYEEFSKMIKQTLTDRTKSIWHPKIVKGLNSLLRYTDEP